VAFDYARFGFGFSVSDGVALIEFDDTARHNAWSMPRMANLTGLLTELEDDQRVRSVVLFSGVGRSFGVGGDFHETVTFTGGDEVDRWIDQVTDLYVAGLRLTRPVIAAVDGYAIGIGLQLALTADYRIGSSRSVLKMPEFELGIACTFGGYMLEKIAGRAVMQNMTMSCDAWDAARAERDNLLHEVAAAEDLREAALYRARRAAGFTVSGFRSTKTYLNADFIAGLERTRVEGKAAHRAAFSAGDARQNMNRVIKRETAPAGAAR
jgi:enoyl-CoA hydratase/carnithine racemase